MNQWEIMGLIQEAGGEIFLSKLKKQYIGDNSGFYRKLRKLKEYRVITFKIDKTESIIQLKNNKVIGIGKTKR